MPKRTTPPPAPGQAISYTIADARTVSGLGTTKLYELINEGKLKTVKIGRRRLVRADSLRRLIEGAAM